MVVNEFDSVEQLKEGVLFLVDKPLNWTSFDVVNKLRYQAKRITGVKRFKVGHAGTLDPLASGLLLICMGKYTKQIHTLQKVDKTYSGEIYVGATTPSYDSETQVDEEYQVHHISPDLIDEQVKAFTGSLNQVPPIYSAKRVDGEKAYVLARKGEKPALKPNQITIHSFEVESSEFPVLKFEVSCSKGTYIRSLAHDFGRALQSGGYLKSLRRIQVGKWHVKDARTIDELVTYFQSKEPHVQTSAE